MLHLWAITLFYLYLNIFDAFVSSLCVCVHVCVCVRARTRVSGFLGDGRGNAQLSMVTVEAVDMKSSSVTSSLVVRS